MKKVKITIKNFYTREIMNKKNIETFAKTYKELIEELKYELQEIIIFDEINKEYISENNIIVDESEITIINADGQGNSIANKYK
ncbi:MAG: hypothetical protein Q4G09_05170 [Clostridia bacterium]|nr:hypothetical protein [Clostridia bacterium]